jgi:hypothetical protein
MSETLIDFLGVGKYPPPHAIQAMDAVKSAVS